MKKNINKILIESDRIYLRKLTVDDDLTSYLSWINDNDVINYMNIRNKNTSIDDLKKYIKLNLDLNNYLCGIFIKNSDVHVGNVLFSEIDNFNKKCPIGILVGKEHWGNGYGNDAVDLMCEYAFKILKFHKIVAGVVVENTGSVKLFENTGFILEGIKKEEFKMDDRYLDVLYFGRINNEK